MRTTSTKHLPALDGLRGVAAILVLFGHATAIALEGNGTFVPRKELAVTFFWMLSGFVLALAYDQRMRTGMTVRDYLLRRVIRLYPLIVLGAGGG